MRQEIAGFVIVFRNSAEFDEKLLGIRNEVKQVCERAEKEYKDSKKKLKIIQRCFANRTPVPQTPSAALRSNS